MSMALYPEGSDYFPCSPLHRSHSRPKFIAYQTPHSESRSESKTSGEFNTIISSTFSPSPSAPPNSSAHSSSLLFNASFGDHGDEEQIIFPFYNNAGYYGQVEDLLASASSRMGDSYTVLQNSTSISASVSREQSPGPIKYAEDDTVVRTRPFKHVDYLSHKWKEDDLWSSWRHIVSKRTAYSNSARLENTCWRTWMKLKYKLKTVSPESLNW
jgi:hypothetical protein